jgi:DHA1 family tetracycline resistance protein-like MFS transporter
MLAVYAMVFLDSLSVSTVQLLQPYYALRVGATPDLVTMVSAAFMAAQFVGAPLSGRASDGLGRRRTLLLTLAGSTAASLLLLIVDTLPALVAVRALAGLAGGTALVATAAVADLTTPERRARGIANIGVAGGLGYIVGPVLAGHLAGPAGGGADFQSAFCAAAASSGVAWVVAAIGVRETAPHGGGTRSWTGGRFAALRGVLARPQFGLVLALVFVPPVVGALIEPVLALWTEAAHGWGPERLGYAYSLMGIATVVTQGALVAPAIARLGVAGTVTLGALATGAAPLWLVLAAGDGEIMAAIALLIFGMATSATALTTHVTRIAAPAERGTLLGIASLSSAFGRIAGPLAGGPLYAHVAMTAPFVLGIGAAAVMGALSLRLRPAEDGGRAA